MILKRVKYFVLRDVIYHENEFPFASATWLTAGYDNNGGANVAPSDNGVVDLEFLDDLEYVLKVKMEILIQIKLSWKCLMRMIHRCIMRPIPC